MFEVILFMADRMNRQIKINVTWSIFDFHIF